MVFQSLVVLTLNLEFGLQFFYKKFEACDFGAKFVDVGGRGSGAVACRGCLRRSRWRGLYTLLDESFGEGTRPDGFLVRFCRDRRWNWNGR